MKPAISIRTKRQSRSAGSEANGTTVLRRKSQNAVAIKVLKKFRCAFRLVKAHSSTTAKRSPVSSAQMAALCELAEHPGLRVSDLANALALHQSTISNLIDKLLQKQLIRRKPDNEDARVVRLYLTPASKRVVLTSSSAPHNVLLDTLERLSLKTLRLLDRELARVLDRG
jgi:DNA-binding MarR family transcriptional regulator